MTTMKFRKKPVIIEAMQFDGWIRTADPICRWANDGAEEPWITYVTIRGVEAEDMMVHTLEGDMGVSPGDWVIKGVKGEFYPCKPDIFEATYDRVQEPLAETVHEQREAVLRRERGL